MRLFPRIPGRTGVRTPMGRRQRVLANTHRFLIHYDRDLAEEIDNDNFDPDLAARDAGILGVMSQQDGAYLASPYGGLFNGNISTWAFREYDFYVPGNNSFEYPETRGYHFRYDELNRIHSGAHQKHMG